MLNPHEHFGPNLSNFQVLFCFVLLVFLLQMWPTFYFNAHSSQAFPDFPDRAFSVFKPFIKILIQSAPLLKTTEHNYRPLDGCRPCSPRGNFGHYDFLIQHYICHKIRHVSPLRSVALSCNIKIAYVTLVRHWSI